MDEVLVLTGEGNVDVQLGGPGQSAWKYLSACAAMDGPSVPREGTELRYCQDPTRAGKFIVSTKIKTTADQASGNLMTKLGKTKYLDKMDCAFALRARFAKCGARENVANFDPLMVVFCDVDLTSVDYGDLVASSPDNNDEIMVTSPWTASYSYEIRTVVGSRLGSLADLGDQAINDLAVCDAPQCAGYCGTRKDGCSTFYGVTDKDSTPYAWPNLITGLKNVLTNVVSWYTHPVIGIDGNLENVECAGDRVLVTSNSASLLGYNDTFDDYGAPDQDTWNLVTLIHAPAANPNALHARTTREIWYAAADGYVGKSSDAGETWSYVNTGAGALNCIWAYDADLIYVGGNNGAVYRSTDGGTSWTDVSDVATFAANVLVVKVPSGRINEVFVGTNAGEIYKSVNKGATWAEMSFTGNGVGSVDAMAFCGPCGGDVLWILHNDAGPRGRILRDLSGGYGGADVRVEAGYTSIISAGVDLNSLICCDENTAYAVGEVAGTYPAWVKVG